MVKLLLIIVKIMELHERFFDTFDFSLEFGEITLAIEAGVLLCFTALSAYEHVFETHAGQHHDFFEVTFFPFRQVAVSFVAFFCC